MSTQVGGSDAEANAPARVLVVDDDPEIVKMLRLRLVNAGYDVLHEGDGDTGLAAAREHHPAVVVLDVMMPGKSGWEVARELKGDDATADIKIVMLTAIGAQVNEMTAPLYGADAHIDKPFDFGELERTIASLLES